MARGTPSEAEVANTLSQLKLSTTAPQKIAAKPKSRPVADSWDEDGSSGSATETDDQPVSASLSRASTKERDSLSPISTVRSNPNDLPHPPPPTPASPTNFNYPDNTPYAAAGAASGGRDRAGSATSGPAKRPEKTTAVAGRLIAGALGVRAPKRTEEEREFDKAVREKERRRRDEERGREKRELEAAEERKRSVWED